MMLAKSATAGEGGWGGECPVACGKWGPDASGEATSRSRAVVGGKGPHLSTASPIPSLSACCRAILHTRDTLPVCNRAPRTP